MLYRMRVYRAVPASLSAFHQFFRERLLPVQLRYGARLVGRWETEDGRVVAVWEYDDRESYERIEAAVRADPDSRRAQEHRRTSLPELFASMEETFMTSASGWKDGPSPPPSGCHDGRTALDASSWPAHRSAEAGWRVSAHRE